MRSRRNIFALLLTANLWAVLPLTAAAVTHDARRADGALAQVFICFASGAPPRSDVLPGRPGPRNDRAACMICQVFCSGHAPLPAQSGHVSATPVPSLTLAWTEADRAAPTPRRLLSHRARAPPAAAV